MSETVFAVIGTSKTANLLAKFSQCETSESCTFGLTIPGIAMMLTSVLSIND